MQNPHSHLLTIWLLFLIYLLRSMSFACGPFGDKLYESNNLKVVEYIKKLYTFYFFLLREDKNKHIVI